MRQLFMCDASGPRRLASTLLVGWALGGCVGTIGEKNSPASGDGTSMPGDPSGGNATPAGTGMGDGSGNGSGIGKGPEHPDPAVTNPGRANDLTDPGRVTIRRMNHAEYNNTVRDLLGTTLRPADGFESDPIGHGFDNNGDVQTLTTLQIEQYQSAAEALAADVTTGGTAKLAAAARTTACDVQTAGLACVDTLVTGLAKRAWRRPVERSEIERVLAVAKLAADRGEDKLAQLRFAVAAVLVSPHFFFRVELDPDPRSETPHALDPYELATRLSYLLYRSMPDDALFEAAAGNRLGSDADVRREVMRMLGDPKSDAFLEAFAGQWLDLESLDDHEVDPTQFSKVFDKDLARLMRGETMRFVTEFLRENLPITDLLTARFGFVDARLAQHYGLPAPAGAGMTKVQLNNEQRVGILTQASMLTATSLPNRTSAVTRGAWVLAHLMCAPPPPPPPDVPELPETDGAKPQSARAKLEQHRKDPACSGCHNLIDPIGLGLENYDAIGRWRETEDGQPIDVSGTLPDGSQFKGAVALAGLLAKDPRVPTCMAANLYTYAVSRLADGGGDAAHVDAIVAGARNGANVGMRDLVLGLTTSVPFRQRRGESESKTTMTGARP